MAGMAQDDDMSFSDWSAHLDSLSADSNHCWLPAYGLQPPIDQGPAQQQFLFLETIQEETSDDLRSESSRSSHAGWPESDSDAGSVIHIAATYNGEDHHATNGPSSWSGSERDLAVPPKRRRQDDGWGTGVALSRSSSLIAFESLERRLSEEEEALTGTGLATGIAAFRTTATLRPFDWNDSASPSASDEDSEDDDQDSDDSLLQSFNSSRGSFRSSAGSERLRSFRSLDSLSLLQSTSGGTVNSGGAAYLSRPCQDLSLSSEGDAAAAAGGGGGDDVFEPRFCLGRQERSHSLSPKPSLRSLLDATYSLSDHEDHEDMDQHVMDAMDAAMEDMDKHMDHSAAMTRDDFLDGPDEASSVHHSSSSSSSSSSDSSGNDDVIAMLPVANVAESTPGSGRTQRSAENLSEDSGFGEHAALPTGKRLTVCPILEDDVVDDDSCSSSCYSACSSSSGGGRKKTDEVNLEWGASDAKFSAGWHRSAPDLLVCSLAAVADAHPLSEHPDKHPVVPVGLLAGPPTMASTPDLAGLGATKQQQLHDEGLSKALSTGTALGATATSKGVHFCPVVAEVSWRDSYSDVDDEDEEDIDETDGPRSDREDDDEEDEDEDHEDEEEVHQGVAYKLQVAGVVADVHRQAKQTTAAAPQPDSASPAAAGPAGPHRAQAKPSVTSMAAPKPQALPPGAGSATTSPASSPASSPATSPTSSPKKTSRFGDFFQRFSLRRLSGRHHDHAKKLTRSKSAPTSPPPGATKQQGTNTQSAPPYEDVRIIPLHPTPEELEPHAVHHHHHQLSLHRDASPGGMLSAGSQDNNSRAKSMEFLLDRRNQEAVQPPENALQGLQGRVLSEHELRVQRSLQQLNVPDWYKNSSRPAEGFLLKRGSDATSVAGRRGAGGWPGLGVKTTSLSSLRSPTTAVRLGSSPSPPPAAFTRWSSSRLHSAGSASATPSTSPCGSARSSFNHRQPYLGWRSQERLSGTPRTPAERLAQGLLEQREHQRQQERLRGSSQLQSSSPNLSDVRSSIKEVTSAIVHYVSAANDPGSNTDVRLAGHSPAPSTATNTSRDREDHPRSHSGHSNQRVCWIESSFVGSRPIEQPQTPEEGSVSTSPLPVHHQDLYLDLKQRNSSCATGASGTLPSNGPATVPGHGHGAHQSHGVAAAAAGTAAEVESPASPVAAAASGPCGPCGLNAVVSRPSPSSTTMEDVLDSLLGLPPPSRSPSPGPNTNTASNASNGSSSSQQVSCTAATAVTQVQVQSAQHQGHQGHQASLRTCADIRPDPAGSASAGEGGEGLEHPAHPAHPAARWRGVDGHPEEEEEADDGPEPAGWEAADLAGVEPAAGASSRASKVAEDLPGWDSAPPCEAREDFEDCEAPPGWQGKAVVGVVAEEGSDSDDAREEAEFGAALLSLPLDAPNTRSTSTPRRRRSESSALEHADRGEGRRHSLGPAK
ncbi:uncharacterized protein LOC117641165, partial [Thrips palmi]|uniref:Uncharacterized protein LOC117641165 n=1 Tax=Thrips palmi TaxID=161013 RepID=A0A6P8ZIU1_THRPL